MRFFVPVALGVLSLFLLLACESSTHAGIEIGNPEIQARAFVARFVVDYGTGEDEDSSALTGTVRVDGVELSLSRLAAYSSYYTYVSFDLENGQTLWPENSETPANIAFAEDSAVEPEAWKAALGDIEIDEDGLLKEVGAMFSPVKNSPRLTGSVLRNGTLVPFAFSLSGIDSLEVLYLKDQLDTSESGAISLTVRFRVPVWVEDLSFDTAELLDDTLRLDAMHNVALWDSLTARFGLAFSSKHRIVYFANGTSENAYAERTLLDYDIVDSNWVTNGNFADGGKNWYLVEQLGGVADTSVENGAMQVRISSGGTQNYSVQLIHEDIPLLENRKYKLVFTGVADTPSNFMVRMGSYSTYTTEAFQRNLVMDTLWKSFEFEYTALVTDLFARLEFNLGKNKSHFQFKEVKIYRID
jgi:hypothetical protein